MLYKEKPEVVLIAVSVEGDEVTEPRYITGKSVAQVLAVIDAAFPAAESDECAPKPAKARKARRTKAEMEAAASTGPAEKKKEVWPE